MVEKDADSDYVTENYFSSARTLDPGLHRLCSAQCVQHLHTKIKAF